MRGTLVAVVGIGCVLLSAGLMADSRDSKPRQPDAAATPTLSIAPLSLGNPAAAAGPRTRPPVIPVAATIPGPPPGPFTVRQPLHAERGDTLSGILLGAGVARGEAAAAIDALRDVFDPRYIRPGHEITVVFRRETPDDDPGTFMGFSVSPDFSREFEVARAADGAYTAHETEKALDREPTRASGTISASLFADGVKAGVPVPVLVELIRAYSWDVDFQRDIWPGDKFEVMWQRYFDGDGDLVHDGAILYAKLTLSGTAHPIYRFKTGDGDIDFYNEKGQSARKALMRTPIDGARLSSTYGKRKHPILGYTKMHKGVDFAAPIGTPIYAAGDGRIEMARRYSSYGNYVRIRHNAEYSTAYAHLSRFARISRKGNRVRQGQVIGYVGETGRATGPHLHYEILLAGRQVNPLKVRMPSGRKLKGTELARFEAEREQLDARFAGLPAAPTIAGTAD